MPLYKTTKFNEKLYILAKDLNELLDTHKQYQIETIGIKDPLEPDKIELITNDSSIVVSNTYSGKNKTELNGIKLILDLYSNLKRI